MRSDGPVVLAFPPFRGATRRLILLALGAGLAFFVLNLIIPGLAGLFYGLLSLHPDQATRLVWQFATYPFIPEGFLGLLFGALSLWYFGSVLEDERGARWLGELFLVASIGGAILATLISLVFGRYIPVIDPVGKSSNGLWPTVLALMLVYARLHANESLTVNFIIRARAKYIVAGTLLIYLVFDIIGFKRFDALNTVCNCLCAWLFVQFAPHGGLRFAFSEGMYGLRNRYYRAKRRRAAKKFTVYMRKQGKDVSIDASGRYIGLDDEDPTDPRRMN
ncbi:MAG TPA: rhomboid family intramembrane serine protease [Acidobacteriaceae bacterium]|jgi:membrane associated rhomboid family serine protease|nr:rhomboid family intramembrane serine protease [Acidobacteriaceae bacterium]